VEPERNIEKDIASGAARVNPHTGQVYVTTTWAAVDLESYKRGEKIIEPPAFLYRDDGRALIYPNRPHVFYGESESLKSWAALLACRDVVAAGHRALYVDMEGSEPSFVERCRLVHVAEGMIGDALRYVRPMEPLIADDARSDFWLHELELFGPTLVVLDGVTELYSLQDWDINKATDATKFQKTFGFRGLCASIAIDHTAKDAGRGSIGSQHKRAGLDGAEYLFESLVRGGRGGESISRVRVTKDRHGFVREFAGDVVGSLRVFIDGVNLEAPKIADLVNPKDDAIDAVFAFLTANPGSSFRAIREGVHLRTDRVQDAVSALQVKGLIVNTGSSSRGRWSVKS
jgi:hypothetical protein